MTADGGHCTRRSPVENEKLGNRANGPERWFHQIQAKDFSMNTATNTTTASPAATTLIEQLITAHIEAVAHHDRAFDLIDWKLATEDEFGDTIGPVDDAIIALCSARPSSPEEATLKRDYLKSELFSILDSNLGMTKRAVIALLDAAGEPEARPAEDAAGPAMLRELMQLARKIDNVQDILVAATSLNSAVAMAMEARPQGDAIGAITGEVEHKINLARDQLAVMRKALS